MPDGALTVEKAMYKVVFLYAWCTNACLPSFFLPPPPSPYGVCQYHCLRIDVYQSHDCCIHVNKRLCLLFFFFSAAAAFFLFLRPNAVLSIMSRAATAGCTGLSKIDGSSALSAAETAQLR